MVVCTPFIEEFQRDIHQAIQERMSGHLPVTCEGDEFETYLKKFGVDGGTMTALRNGGCSSLEALKQLDDSDFEDLNILKLQIKCLKKALADLRGENANPQAPEQRTDAITVQNSAVNVTGASGGARVMVAEGGAVKTAGGNLNIKDSPVTAKDVQGNVNIGAILK